MEEIKAQQSKRGLCLAKSTQRQLRFGAISGTAGSNISKVALGKIGECK